MIFRKELKKSAQGSAEEVQIKDKVLLIVGLAHLSVCTLILAIGSYIDVEMWIVSLVSALSLLVVALVYCICRKKKPVEIVSTLKRAPWQLIPFVLSMFTIILALQANSVTDVISKFLGNDHVVLKYGTVSFLSANLINNIPMSVFFCSVIAPLSGVAQTQAIYATIVGSNLGAILTPIGALAGIMWSSLLKTHQVKFSYLSFIKYGVLISIPSLAANLLSLILIL